MVAEHPPVDVSLLQQRFANLQAYAPKMAQTSAHERKQLLKKLLAAVVNYRADIQEALYADYERNPLETDLADTWVVLKEIKFAIRHVEDWMRPKRVPTPLPFFGAQSQIVYEAKGVALIISPWNFPFNLSFAPLVSAIAAGNTVMLKPSEFTHHSSLLIKQIVQEVFPEEMVCVELGGIALSKELLKLPFNHIFFTGSPAVGKVVMKAAADHLASVTLELGGKSPTIIDAGVNLRSVAKHVAYSKFSNKGQICIATDYLLVHEAIKADFVVALQQALQELYPGEVHKENADYPRIVDVRHVSRIKNLVEDALQKGAKLCTPFEVSEEEKYISPTVLEGITPEMNIAHEEIFGPVLPILSFADAESLLATLKVEEKPLAIYIFTPNNRLANRLVAEVSAGAVVVNEVFIHHFNSYLPFGGVGQSGQGKSHGRFGFLEFSNQKAVVHQWLPWRISALLHPPYTPLSKWLTDSMLKFFS